MVMRVWYDDLSFSKIMKNIWRLMLKIKDPTRLTVSEMTII